MKKLRKLLAVVLVIALAFSLVTMAAATTVKDYSDESSIKQTEAVDLFTQLGFLQGNGGAFSPTSNITREAAAKIITYMLIGSAKADALKVAVTSFSDVAPSRWSAAYIEYCAANGIINGDGTGKFNPEGFVTGTQFAKMLLTAVGYGKAGEYLGANWELAVIGDATRLGIFSLDVDVTAAATREECAQYAFNAYCFISQVVYNATTKSYQAAFNTVDPYVTIDVASTLAYQQGVYSGYVILNGHAYRYWYLANGATVSGYYLKENLVATSTDGSSITALTTPTNDKYKGAVVDAYTRYFYNGTEVYFNSYNGGTLTTTVNIKVTGDDINDRAQHKGVTVQLIKTDGDNFIDIVNVTEKEVLKLGAAPVVNATTGNVTIPGIPGLTDYKASYVLGYSGLAAGDWVLWYRDAYGTYHIDKAQSITGQMTSFTPGPNLGYGWLDTMTFGGALKFNTGLIYTATDAMDYPIYTFANGNIAAFNADATAWLDDGGNVIYVKTNAAAPTFACGIVIDYQYYPSLLNMPNMAMVKIFKEDGTVGTYYVAGNNLGIVRNQSADFDFTGAVYGYLCKYLVDSAGKVTLISATNADGTPNTTYYTDVLANDYAAKATALDNVTDDVQLSAASKVFYFDTSAAYNAVTNPAYVTTGTANTALVVAGTDVSFFAPNPSFKVADGVLFDVLQPVYTGNNYAYVVWPGVSTSVVNGVNEYTYMVYVNGAYSPLKSYSATEFAGSGLWCYKVDSNGYVLPGTSDQTTRITNLAGAAGVITAVTGNYISYDLTSSVVIDSNTKYYFVSTSPVPFGTVTASTLAVGYNIEYVQMGATAAAAIYFTA